MRAFFRCSPSLTRHFLGHTRPVRHALAALMALLLSACNEPHPLNEPENRLALQPVSAQRILSADQEPHNWLSHGRTYDEQRSSPLQNITPQNISGLGLAWYYDFETQRGMEATPLVADGRLYVTSSWSRVYAFDAKTGAPLWQYDPKVPRSWGINLCCDAVNRGVALWQDRLYLGTLDGRLIALNTQDGSLAWSVQTTPTDKPYSITGAPRVVKGKVMIGNGGAELGVRGYISAYDAQSGDLVWRFYTVPGDPALPLEHDALAQALPTWKGGHWWEVGGGGTVWDSMAYDAQLDLLYFGVGNGSPWSRTLRSPGGGDNLYLSSIVAVRPDTGEYVWHYQTTPGDSWDYTATQHMILSELEIDGTTRKVIMQAPKNGFFYVLDRETGALISATPYVAVNWASHVDTESGRPVVNPAAYYGADAPFAASPGPAGGHTWQPMSYLPSTGLVYLPTMETLFPYQLEDEFRYHPFGWNTGINDAVTAMPEQPEARAQLKNMLRGQLVAWDPVAQEPKWRVQHASIWNGGVLSTAANLLFQGNGEGFLNAYQADSGEKLWSFFAQTGIMAAPISYAIGDEQYIAVTAGWGGGVPLIIGGMLQKAANQNLSRLLVFKLGAEQQLPPLMQQKLKVQQEPPTGTAEQIAQGKALYHKWCANCHGNSVISGGVLPDLRQSQMHSVWQQVVLEGLLESRGMVSFAPVLNKTQAEAIRQYVLSRAQADFP